MPYPRLSGIGTVPYAPANRSKTYTVVRCHRLPPSVLAPALPREAPSIALCLTLSEQMGLALTSLRRPAIRLGAGAAHQHCPFGVAQAVTLKEGLDGLLIVDDSERARPVRAPQAAIETPGVEHAGKRVPDVRERIRLARQRAGAADLDHRVRALGEFQHLREIGPG